MSHRDSHSKRERRRSRFDREPSGSFSPKRYKKDGKQERDRVTTSANGEQRQHHLLRESPLAHHSSVALPLHKDLCEAPKHAPDSTQHDEQGSAWKVGRSSGQRKAGERGWWKDLRNQHNEKAETSQGREKRDEKSQTKPDDNTLKRRDGFSERKVDPPPTSRKRPAFREKKIPVDSGDANRAATVAVKSSQIDHPPERKEERSSNPHHLHRRDGFPSRGKYSGNGNYNYRGRDKFNGSQGYDPSKTRTEKWKHDLYQEVNKDPVSQNEDDQIAKVEALLAS